MILALLALAVQTDVSFEEKKLATVPKEARLRRAVFSACGRLAAFVSTQGRKEYVTVGDRKGEALDRVDDDSLVLSAGMTAGYRAKLGTEWIVVVGGTKSEPYQAAIGPFVSPDGAAWAYGGRKRGGLFEVVLNGKKDDAFEDVGLIEFAAGGAPVYVARKERQAYVIVAGRPNGPYDEVSPLIFTPDRATMLFVAKKDGRYAVASAREAGEFFDEVHLADPPFAPDGSLAPYEARVGGRSWIMVGDRRVGGDYDSAETPSFNGGVLTYAARKGGRRYVVAGGRKGPDYDAVGPPQVSVKGEVAYAATKGGKDFVVRAGVAGPSFDLVGGPVYSADGAACAYPAWQERQVSVIVDGEKGEPFDEMGPLRFAGARPYFRGRAGGTWHVVVGGVKGPAFARVEDPVFGAGGAYAYRAQRDDRRHVVVGVDPSDAFKDVGAPVVSAQGHVAFTATGADGRAYLIVNKKKHGPFDATWPPVFDAQGLRAAFGAQIGSELWWKVVPVE